MSKYVIVDLEMCNVIEPVCREKFQYGKELIEIGAVLLDEDFEIADKFKTFVSPEYGRIDSYIQKLTGITPEDVDGAPDANKAIQAFADWLPDDAILVSWSLNDELQIRTEMKLKNLSITKLEKYLNSWEDCQQIFGEKMESPKTYKLSEALIIANIDFDERIHDALVDAENTALLFAKMKKENKLELISCYRTENDENCGYSPFADLLQNLQIAV